MPCRAWRAATALVGLLLSLRASGAAETPALHLAAQVGDARKLARLLAEEQPVDARDASGATALIVAAKRGRLDCVQVLLGAGADLEARDRFRM